MILTLRFVVSTLLASLTALGVLGGCSRDDTIVVGAKSFTEGYLLGHIAVMLLEDAGYRVDEQFGVASAAMRSALETGQIDLYYEYTGTAYVAYHGMSDRDVMVDSARVLRAVRSTDSARHGLVWLAPLPFDDTYALLMRSGDARERNVFSLTDLGRSIAGGTSTTIAVDAEFYERDDGYKPLAALYGFEDAEVRKLDAGLIYQALNAGEVDVAMGYSTDGRIAAFDLVALEDDRHYFPKYHPAAVVRRELLETHPDVRRVLMRLNQHIDAETIQRLNAEVDVDHRDPRKVARRWLLETGLIEGDTDSAQSPPPISM